MSLSTTLLLIKDDMKEAMKAKAKERLGTIRLILAAVKQQEVDTRKEVDEAALMIILDKMVKQRRDSIAQYEQADRNDLADVEKAELAIITTYLPEPLTEAEISALIEEAVAATEAASMADMGKVMGMLKPKLQGRADMGKVSGQIKAKLS